MSSIGKVISHLQKVAEANKKKDCSLSIGSKFKINSFDIVNKKFDFTLPVVFSGKSIDYVVLFSSDVLANFRQEYFTEKLPYKIENGLKVSGELQDIETTDIVKGEVVIKYNLKMQLTLK